MASLSLRFVLFGIYFAGATFLVCGHQLPNRKPVSNFDGLSIAPVVEEATVDIGFPPRQEFMLQAAHGNDVVAKSTSAGDIRPAWGMLAAVIVLWVYLCGVASSVACERIVEFVH